MTRKRIDKGLLAIAVLLVTLGLAACGSSDDTSSSASGDSSAAANGEGSSEGSKEEVSVSMELTFTGQGFAQEQQHGIEDFTEEDGGVELEVNGPPGPNPELAQKQASDMLTKSPDAMGVSPFPPELWMRTMTTISEQVPHSLTFSERPASEPEDAAAAPIHTFVGFNDKAIGREVVEEAIKLGKLPKSTTGEVIFGQCAAGDSGVLAQRIEGFEEAATKLLPQAKIETFISGAGPQANLEGWTNELAAHPDPILVSGTCDPDGASAYKLKRRTGADYLIAAVELPPETVEGLEDGSVITAIAANHWLAGYAATRMLTEAARGTELPEGFVDVGRHLFTGKDIAEIEARSADPAAFYAPLVDEIFANGMPEAQPIENAWK